MAENFDITIDQKVEEKVKSTEIVDQKAEFKTKLKDSLETKRGKLIELCTKLKDEPTRADAITQINTELNEHFATASFQDEKGAKFVGLKFDAAKDKEYMYIPEAEFKTMFTEMVMQILKECAPELTTIETTTNETNAGKLALQEATLGGKKGSDMIHTETNTNNPTPPSTGEKKGFRDDMWDNPEGFFQKVESLRDSGMKWFDKISSKFTKKAAAPIAAAAKAAEVAK